ncbi:MAG: formyltransferase family protein [Thermodesulfobacteriota bacterium]
MRAAFLGQKAIAAACLEILLEQGHRGLVDVAVLVSGTDFRDAFADRFEVPPLFIPNAERGTDALLAAMKVAGVDLLISVQHPWILPSVVIEATPRGAFNLHNARLPDYRGHGSISHAILHGDQTYATTIHWMAPEVDRGPIVCEQEVPVGPGETALSLYGKTLEASARNFRDFLRLLSMPQGPPRIPMREGGRFYGKDSLAPLKLIANPADPVEVDRKSRAFHFPPHEPAYIVAGGAKHYVTPASGGGEA